MNDLALVVLLLLVAVAAAATVLWQVMSRLSGKYRGLLEAVELTQRQLSELRDGVDRLEEKAAGIEERLEETVEPALGGLARQRRVDQVERSVERAAEDGGLAEETRRALSRHLSRLAADDARGQ